MQRYTHTPLPRSDYFHGPGLEGPDGLRTSHYEQPEDDEILRALEAAYAAGRRDEREGRP